MLLKVQTTKNFFIVVFERAAKIRKVAVYRFLISFLVPVQKGVVSQKKVVKKAFRFNQNQ